MNLDEVVLLCGKKRINSVIRVAVRLGVLVIPAASYGSGRKSQLRTGRFPLCLLSGTPSLPANPAVGPPALTEWRTALSATRPYITIPFKLWAVYKLNCIRVSRFMI